jgi:hypothetical protein
MVTSTMAVAAAMTPVFCEDDGGCGWSGVMGRHHTVHPTETTQACTGGATVATMRALAVLFALGLVGGGCCCPGCSCSDEQKALLKAAGAGDAAAVKRFLDAGGSPAMSCWTPEGSRGGSNHSLVAAAVSSGSWQVVSLVAVEPALRDQALYDALQLLDGELALPLLDAGARFEVSSSGYFITTALRSPDPGKRAQSLALLERLGADFDGSSDDEAPLVTALRDLSLARAPPSEPQVIDFSRENVAFLLRHAKNLEVGDHEGARPLHQVVHLGEAGLARLLLERGAHVDGRDLRLRTPLMFVGANLDLARLLLEHGAQLEARDDQRRTPLLHAVEAGDLPVVQLLVARGASLDAADAQGNTARSIAEVGAAESGDQTLLKFLEQHGATRQSPPTGAGPRAHDAR